MSRVFDKNKFSIGPTSRVLRDSKHSKHNRVCKKIAEVLGGQANVNIYEINGSKTGKARKLFTETDVYVDDHTCVEVQSSPIKRKLSLLKQAGFETIMLVFVHV